MANLTAHINQQLFKKVDINITLTRDEGYHTLTYDDGERYEARTVMTPYTKDFSVARWLEEARDFLQDVKGSA